MEVHFSMLQLQYTALQFFYWLSNCVIFGYSTVFLTYKGLSNSEIGVVVGTGAVLSIVVSPMISSLTVKRRFFTIKRTIIILYFLMVSLFVGLGIFELPPAVVMAAFVVLICSITSLIPLLSVFCMNYIKAGFRLNFGLARGIGSISYALSAMAVGQLVTRFGSGVVPAVFAAGSVLVFLVLCILPPQQRSEDGEGGAAPRLSFLLMWRTYRRFFCILIGFALLYGSSSAMSTYLINIVNHLGGDTSPYGVAVFCSAASEMPFMAITHRLLKRFGSRRLLIFAAICYVIKNFIICLAPSLPILMFGMMFQGASFGLFTATVTYFVEEEIAPEHEMMGQTMITAMSSGVGSTIGNVCGGFLQDTFGLSSLLVFICSGTTLGATVELAALHAPIGMRGFRSTGARGISRSSRQ